jgi:hypothetical protein
MPVTSATDAAPRMFPDTFHPMKAFPPAIFLFPACHGMKGSHLEWEKILDLNTPDPVPF